MKARRFTCPHCGQITFVNKSGTVRVHNKPGTKRGCIIGGAWL